MRDVDGKLRYNRNGKAKTRQPKKSDVLIVAIIREGGTAYGEALEVIRADEGRFF